MYRRLLQKKESEKETAYFRQSIWYWYDPPSVRVWSWFLSKLIVANVFFLNITSSSDDKSSCSLYDCLLFILCSLGSPSLPVPSKSSNLARQKLHTTKKNQIKQSESRLSMIFMEKTLSGGLIMPNYSLIIPTWRSREILPRQRQLFRTMLLLTLKSA